VIQHWRDWTPAKIKLSWAKAMLNPWFFLTTFAYTTDPHAPQEPIKLFPQKSYLEFLVSEWLCTVTLGSRKFATHKSRKLLITWLACGLGLWDILSHAKGGRRGFIQSVKEDKADELVQRVWSMYELLPPLVTEATYSFCKVKFPSLASMIQGVPQGRDVIRQETASWVISDELAFQEFAEDAYMAAKPTLDGGGWYWAISTPNGLTFFRRLIRDEGF